PRIRCDDDIERLIYTAHRILTRNITCGGMFLKQIAGKSGCDLLIAVECDIESKIHASQAGDLAHVVMYGIALSDAPCCVRMSDASRVGERPPCSDPRQSRCDHFRSAAESGEEMRFYESRGDLEIASDPFTIQVHAHSTGVANVNKRGCIPCIVAYNAAASRELASYHALDFFVAVAPVCARCNEDSDIGEADSRHL